MSIDVISYLVPPDVIKVSPFVRVLESVDVAKVSVYLNVVNLYFLTVLVDVIPFSVT